LDAGSSNPNGIGALQMDKACDELVPNSFPYVSVGGGDYNPMDDSLVMDCSNPKDDVTTRVYFVCCVPGDCSTCKDPLITTGVAGSAEISSATTASTGTSTSTSTSTIAAASVAAVVAVAAVGAVGVVVARKNANNEKTNELHAALAQDEVADL